MSTFNQIPSCPSYEISTDGTIIRSIKTKSMQAMSGKGEEKKVRLYNAKKERLYFKVSDLLAEIKGGGKETPAPEVKAETKTTPGDRSYIDERTERGKKIVMPKYEPKEKKEGSYHRIDPLPLKEYPQEVRDILKDSKMTTSDKIRKLAKMKGKKEDGFRDGGKLFFMEIAKLMGIRRQQVYNVIVYNPRKQSERIAKMKAEGTHMKKGKTK